MEGGRLVRPELGDEVRSGAFEKHPLRFTLPAGRVRSSKAFYGVILKIVPALAVPPR
jgi:hypothetical protein